MLRLIGPWFLAALLTALNLGVGQSPASAHAALVDSSPQDGSSVAAEPTSVTLTFADILGQPAYVVVIAPDLRHRVPWRQHE